MEILNKILIRVLISVASAIILSMLYFIINIHDTINYKQPQRDMLQDTIMLQISRQMNEQFLLCKDKNINTQKRINSITDGWKTIEIKLDRIIKQQNFIFRTVKELKPYSEFLALKDTL